MNATHIIRLRGPWRRQVVAGAAPIASTTTAERPVDATVTMPSDWSDDLGPDFRGTLEYQRWFNKPTNIDDDTRLQLSLREVIGDQLEVTLNGDLLGRLDSVEGCVEFDITSRLQPRNDLRIRLSVGQIVPPDKGNGGGLVGEVRLEIG